VIGGFHVKRHRNHFLLGFAEQEKWIPKGFARPPRTD